MRKAPADGVRHVHLFHGSTLLGTVEEPGTAPQQQYDFAGRRYRSISYMEVTEYTGDRGFDVQVEPVPPPDYGG